MRFPMRVVITEPAIQSVNSGSQSGVFISSTTMPPAYSPAASSEGISMENLTGSD